MIQGGGGPRFALESLQRLRIAGQFLGKELQRDVTAQLEVFGFVYHTHAAATELPQDSIVRDGFADHGRSTPAPSVMWLAYFCEVTRSRMDIPLMICQSLPFL